MTRRNEEWMDGPETRSKQAKEWKLGPTRTRASRNENGGSSDKQTSGQARAGTRTRHLFVWWACAWTEAGVHSSGSGVIVARGVSGAWNGNGGEVVCDARETCTRANVGGDANEGGDGDANKTLSEELSEVGWGTTSIIQIQIVGRRTSLIITIMVERRRSREKIFGWIAKRGVVRSQSGGQDEEWTETEARERYHHQKQAIGGGRSGAECRVTHEMAWHRQIVSNSVTMNGVLGMHAEWPWVGGEIDLAGEPALLRLVPGFSFRF
ncbi:hypothetical protein B0H12DRAFT_1067398 [Mycena haematopus]|nr:hypothetical protein B0H12DRAFT_1067398 [Mycena haematopus]